MPGYTDELPAGEYGLLIEEELIHGLSFDAYRRTGTYLTVQGRGRETGRTGLRAITENDLKEALSRDAVATETETSNHSDAALSPQEDLK